jgi:ribulose-5-phosphate 4-epimerase/fuculose-1-phosphate aldolase
MSVSGLVAQTSDVRPAQMSAAERQTRCDLAAAYQLIDLYGMSDLAVTHISARVPGEPNHFLFNPLGTLFDQITASSLIKVDMDGGLVEGDARLLNPAGFVIHSAVYLAQPNLVCALHTHTPANNAVAAVKEGLLSLNQKSASIQHVLRYHDYEGAAFDLDERGRIARDLGDDGRILLLRNHGSLTVGESIAEAWSWHYLLEMACRYQVQTLACVAGGAHLNPLSDNALALLREQSKKTFSSTGALPIGFEWPSLLRKLERERGASYRS